MTTTTTTNPQMSASHVFEFPRHRYTLSNQGFLPQTSSAKQMGKWKKQTLKLYHMSASPKHIVTSSFVRVQTRIPTSAGFLHILNPLIPFPEQSGPTVRSIGHSVNSKKRPSNASLSLQRALK